MSGEKEVRLRESEYHRLMNVARRVENEQSRAAALATQLRQAQRQIEEQRAATERRQQAFAGAIGNLSQELQASTPDFQQQLQAQRTEYTRGLEQLDQRLAGQRQEYIGLIAEQAAQVEQQFARIEQPLRDLVREARAKLARHGPPPNRPGPLDIARLSRPRPPSADQLANLHLALLGSPGTGKTTLARLIARIHRESSVRPAGCGPGWLR